MQVPLIAEAGATEDAMEEQDKLTFHAPIKLVNACCIAGWIKDSLVTAPEEVIKAIRPNGASQLEAFRGVFEHDGRCSQENSEDLTVKKTHQEIKAQLSVDEKKRRSIAIVWSIVLGCACSGQVYVAFFMKATSHGHGNATATDDEGDDAWQSAWQSGLALAIGFISFAICASMQLVIPLILSKLLARNPTSGKEVRQFLTVQLYDAIVMTRLPNMNGKLEVLLITGFATVGLTFGIMGLLERDAAILAFGHILAFNILAAGNALAGEPSSLQTIREREMLEAMDKTARASGIDMDRTSLKQQLSDFVQHPVHQDTMVVTLSFLTLLAATFDCPMTDSIRLRRFIVQQGFVDTKCNPYGDAQSVLTRSDVAVDTFAGTCHVLDLGNAAEAGRSTRWVGEGERLPWHMALRPQLVPETEQQLKESGMPLGTGLSSKRENSGKWAAQEATKQPQRYLEKARSTKAELDELSMALLGLCSMPESAVSDEDSADPALVLLRAGADVNAGYLEPNGRTPLHYASGLLGDFREKTVKHLIDFGADPHKTDKHGLSITGNNPSAAKRIMAIVEERKKSTT